MADPIAPGLGAPPTDIVGLAAWCGQVKVILDTHNLTGATSSAVKSSDLSQNPPAIGQGTPNDGIFARFKVSGAVPSQPLAGWSYAGAAPWHRISSTSLSGATTDINLPAGFARIHGELRDVIPTTDGDDLWMRVNAGSGIDSTAAHYAWRTAAFDGLAGWTLANSESDTKLIITGTRGIKNTVTEGLSGHFDIYDPVGTTQHKKFTGHFTFLNTANARYTTIDWSAHFIGGLTALTQIEWLLRTGGTIASGTCDLWGILAT